MAASSVTGIIIVNGPSAYTVCYDQAGLSVNIATITWRY